MHIHMHQGLGSAGCGRLDDVGAGKICGRANVPEGFGALAFFNAHVTCFEIFALRSAGDLIPNPTVKHDAPPMPAWKGRRETDGGNA